MTEKQPHEKRCPICGAEMLQSNINVCKNFHHQQQPPIHNDTAVSEQQQAPVPEYLLITPEELNILSLPLGRWDKREWEVIDSVRSRIQQPAPADVLDKVLNKAWMRIEQVAPMDGIHTGWVLLEEVKAALNSLRQSKQGGKRE